MKAPEKIYIPRLEGNETFVHEWDATKFRKYFSREIAENVEYVRADAFIEKACDAYCKACNKPSYSVPISFCRRRCESYNNFIKNIKL